MHDFGALREWAGHDNEDEAEEADFDVDAAQDDGAIAEEVFVQFESGQEDDELTMLGYGVDPANNPPEWVTDEGLWDRAKTAASESYSEEDDAFYPVVTHIYKRLGGTIQGKDD